MMKAFARNLLGVGVSPRVLMARVAALRTLGRLPRPRTDASGRIEQIFFSFPYYSVGDLTLSLTLLDRIHDLWPNAQIDVAVGSSMATLVDAIPHVRHTFRLPRSSFRLSSVAAYLEIRSATNLYRQHIAGISYDLAVAPRWDSFDSFFSAHLAYVTGAPIRCGYSGRSDGGSSAVDRFLTVAAVGGAGEHESLRYARLLARCGLEPAYRVSEDTPNRPIRALQLVAANRRSTSTAMPSPVQGSYAALSPAATKAWHRWPMTHFAEVGRALHRQYGLRTIVIGSSQDSELCSELSRQIGPSSLSMAGKTDALQLIDLIAGADLFIGNDSGPAHLAGGLGIRTITLSPHAHNSPVDHRHSPGRWKPVGDRVQLLQPRAAISPCTGICQHDEAHCIGQIPTEEVLACFEKLLQQSQSQGSGDQRSWLAS